LAHTNGESNQAPAFDPSYAGRTWQRLEGGLIVDEVSAQLDTLLQHVDKTKSDAQAAACKSHDKLKQRIDQAQVDLDTAAKEAQQQVSQVEFTPSGGQATAVYFAVWAIDNARLACSTPSPPGVPPTRSPQKQAPANKFHSPGGQRGRPQPTTRIDTVDAGLTHEARKDWLIHLRPTQCESMEGAPRWLKRIG
jgi:hypothetical protein